MSVIDTLITDRTKEDADHWQALHDKGWTGMTDDEKAEWSSPLKGAYNYSDYNRVGEAIWYLAGKFQAAGYAVTVTSRTDWAVGEIPRRADMDTYLADLSALRGALAVLETTPETPESMELLTWATANDIEKILVDIEALLTSMSSVFLRTAMPWAICGGSGFYFVN